MTNKIEHGNIYHDSLKNHSPKIVCGIIISTGFPRHHQLVLVFKTILVFRITPRLIRSGSLYLIGKGGLVNITQHQLWLLGSTVHHLNSLHQLVQDPDGLQLPLSKQQLPLLRADPLTHLLLLGQAHLVHGLRLPLCLSIHKGQEEGIMFSVPYLAALL